jgi:hypothetical protein
MLVALSLLSALLDPPAWRRYHSFLPRVGL